MRSISGSVFGEVVADLALFDGLVTMLVASTGCCLMEGLEVEGLGKAMVIVGAELFIGKELPLPAPSSVEWKCGTRGGGVSGMLEASCGGRVDTGVGGSEDRN